MLRSFSKQTRLVSDLYTTFRSAMFDPDPNKVKLDSECGLKLLSRLQSKKRPTIVNLSPEIIPQDGPKPGEIIEICGDSGTGKTMQLMELIAQTIIPTEYGGKGAGAIVIDTNSNFHVPYGMPRIIEKHLIHHRTSACTSTDTESLYAATHNVSDIVLDVMKKIMFFKCYTGDELDLTLLYCTNHLTANSNVSLIAVDSIATFYWSVLSEQPIRMETYFRKKLNELRKITDEYKVVAIYTRPADFGNTTPICDEKINYKIHLKHTKGPKESREARNYYSNKQCSRRYLMNDFGIEWISSSKSE